MSINNVVMSGNLSKEPNIKQAGNFTVLELSLAVQEYNSKTKEKQASYFDWIGFGERWEKLAQYIHKGDKVTLQGKARQSSYKNKEGKNVYQIKFILNDIELPSFKKEDRAQENITETTTSIYDENIPF